MTADKNPEGIEAAGALPTPLRALTACFQRLLRQSAVGTGCDAPVARQALADYASVMDDRHPYSGSQLLAASVAGRVVAIAAVEVAQVLPTLPLWRPPTAPAPLCGFVGTGKGILPVLSARALLGLGAETAPGLYAHIIRVERVGGQPAGLLVDRAEGFITPERLQPLESIDTLEGCATAVFSYGEGVGWLIDPSRLLGKAEGEVLTAFSVEAARRRAEWTSAA